MLRVHTVDREFEVVSDARVERIMRRDPTTIVGTETVRKAVAKMSVKGIRHLVVVSPAGTICGLLSQRDIFRYLAEIGHRDAEVRRVMTIPVISGDLDMSIPDAASLMLRERIGCLPILSPSRQLIGILTRSDLLRYVSG